MLTRSFQRWRKTSDRRPGAATIEFALSAPIFFMLLLGMFEFGRVYMASQLLTEAARVGCRKGIVEGTTTQQIKDAVTNYLTAVGISGEAVSVTINDGAGNVTEASSVPAYTEISVVTSVTISQIAWVPNFWNGLFLNGSNTLSGQWTMRRE
jgi:Flp pilus assembly protein TadG